MHHAFSFLEHIRRALKNHIEKAVSEIEYEKISPGGTNRGQIFILDFSFSFWSFGVKSLSLT